METSAADNRDNFITVFRFVLIVVALLPSLSLAHGVRVTASASDEAVVGIATYADGFPLVDAPVKLMRSDPSAGDTLLAQTRSDEDGRFAFPAPRSEGKFLLTVEDGLGHRGTIDLTVLGGASNNPTALPAPDTPATPHARVENSESAPNWARWASGLGYLFGLFGLASWWLSRRNATRSRD
jgi:nickel transport protein